MKYDFDDFFKSDQLTPHLRAAINKYDAQLKFFVVVFLIMSAVTFLDEWQFGNERPLVQHTGQNVVLPALLPICNDTNGLFIAYAWSNEITERFGHRVYALSNGKYAPLSNSHVCQPEEMEFQ